MNRTSLNPYSTPQSRENSVPPSMRDGTIAYLAAGLFVANAMLTLAWLSYFCTVGTSYTLTGATSWTATLREYVAIAVVPLLGINLLGKRLPPNARAIASTCWVGATATWLYCFITFCVTRGGHYIVTGTLASCVIPVAVVIIDVARRRSDGKLRLCEK